MESHIILEYMVQILSELDMVVKHHLLHHHIRKNYLGKIIYNNIILLHKIIKLCKS